MDPLAEKKLQKKIYNTLRNGNHLYCRWYILYKVE